MKRCLVWLLGLTLALSACASETHLPYRYWHLSFSNPPHMPVWVEDAQVVDVTGRHFYNLSPGALLDVGNEGNVNPAGWSSSSGYGPGFDVMGAALPKQVYVRWQSLAEPQTYQATITIPDSVRKLMLTQGPPNPRFTHTSPRDYYYRNLNFGLAPGGWIKVWLSATLDKAIPVMCVKATVVPVGPDQGKMKGRYAYTFSQFSPNTQNYLKKHSIPYASWDCNKH